MKKVGSLKCSYRLGRTLSLMLLGLALVIGVTFATPPIAYFIRHRSDVSLEAHDKIQITQEMASAWPTMYQLTRPLGLIISKPTATECGSSDPSLNAFSCIAKAEVSLASDGSGSADPIELANRLKVFDAQLSKAGWRLDSNDFRYKTKEPFAMWPQNSVNSSALVAYRKEDCYFQSNLSIFFRASKGIAQGHGLFHCAKDDGLPTD